MIVSIFQPASLPASYSFQPLNFRISILLISAGMLHAKDPVAEATKNPMSLLPDGSVLHGVLLPRYDKNRNLVGDLKAEIMTLINAKEIQGEDVLIKFYNPDRTLRGKVQLEKAIFNQSTSQLRADQPVEITTDNLVAKGSGLIYAFQNGQGFLIGPSTTWLSYPEPPSTSMRPTTNQSAALLALCLAPSLTIAAPPANVSDAELAEIKTAAATAKPKLDDQTAAIDTTLTADLTAAQKASDSAHGFVKSADLKNISPEPAAEGAPLEVAPGPNDTVIKCEGGMYFDAEAGVLVYLKNVTVSDPRFTLTGADELKVFFDKKEPKKTTPSDKKKDVEQKEPTPAAPDKTEDEKKQPTKKPDAIGPTANFGDVQKLIATGTVRLKQKGVGGKDAVEASGGLLTYDVPKGEIIISQRYPWVKQGNFYARAKQPNLTLRLLNDGSFSTQGEWEMGGNNLKFDGR